MVVRGSAFAVGSSSNNIFEFVIIASARASLCFSPPDSLLAKIFL